MKSRDHQLNDIKYWLQQHGIHPLVPSNVATTFKRVLKVTDHGIGVLQNWRTCNSYVTLSMIADSMFIVYGPITRLLLHFFVNGKYFESTLYWKCEDLQLTKMDKSTPTIMVRRDFHLHPLQNMCCKLTTFSSLTRWYHSIQLLKFIGWKVWVHVQQCKTIELS